MFKVPVNLDNTGDSNKLFPNNESLSESNKYLHFQYYNQVLNSMKQQSSNEQETTNKIQFLNIFNCVKNQLKPYQQIENINELKKDTINNIENKITNLDNNLTNKMTNKLTDNESKMFKLSEIAATAVQKFEIKNNENLFNNFINYNTKLNNQLSIGEKEDLNYLFNQKQNLNEESNKDYYLEKDCLIDIEQLELNNQLNKLIKMKDNKRLNSLDKDNLIIENKLTEKIDDDNQIANSIIINNEITNLKQEGELNKEFKIEGELVNEKLLLNTLQEANRKEEELVLENRVTFLNCNKKNIVKQKINQSATYGKAKEKIEEKKEKDKEGEEEEDNFSIDSCLNLDRTVVLNSKLDLERIQQQTQTSTTTTTNIQQRLNHVKFNLFNNTNLTSLNNRTNDLLNTARCLNRASSSLIYQTINNQQQQQQQPIDDQLNRHANIFNTNHCMNNNHKLEIDSLNHIRNDIRNDHKINSNNYNNLNNFTQQESTPNTSCFFNQTTTTTTNENPILMKKINSTKRLRLSYSPNLSNNITNLSNQTTSLITNSSNTSLSNNILNSNNLSTTANLNSNLSANLLLNLVSDQSGQISKDSIKQQQQLGVGKPGIDLDLYY